MKKVMKMQIKRLIDRLPAPVRATDGSAGYDLRSAIGAIIIQPGERRIVETGFAWQIPEGFMGLIRPRSGLAVRQGLHVMAGLIDSDYRDEVKVVLVNLGDKPIEVMPADRIAQMVVTSCHCPQLIEVDELDTDDDRGGGFGSTGVK